MRWLELTTRHPANGIAIRRNPASPLNLTRFAPPPSQREVGDYGFPRQCEHWLGMTPLRGVGADRVVRPTHSIKKHHPNGWCFFL